MSFQYYIYWNHIILSSRPLKVSFIIFLHNFLKGMGFFWITNGIKYHVVYAVYFHKKLVIGMIHVFHFIFKLCTQFIKDRFVLREGRDKACRKSQNNIQFVTDWLLRCLEQWKPTSYRLMNSIIWWMCVHISLIICNDTKGSIGGHFLGASY